MQIRSEKDIVCKPFKNHHAEQLKLVTDISWINFERLEDVDRLIESVLTEEGTEDYMDEVRIRAITESVRRRIENLFQFAMSHTPKEILPQIMRPKWSCNYLGCDIVTAFSF